MSENEAREVNIPLLRKAVEWAEAEAAKPPELCEWRQAMWVTAFDESTRRAWGLVAERREREEMGRAAECGTCFCIAGFVVANTVGAEGVRGAVDEEAARQLGIGLMFAHPLFYAGNSIADVRRIAEDLAGERL